MLTRPPGPKRWALTFIIGVLTAFVGIFISFVTKSLTSLKFTVVTSIMTIDEGEAMDDVRLALAFFFFVAFNLFYSLVANTMVNLEPVISPVPMPILFLMLGFLSM